MSNQATIQYIIHFLLGETNSGKQLKERCLAKSGLIGYTDDEKEMKKYAIVIKPSQFFRVDVYGTKRADPILPLSLWRGIPLLFGSPIERRINEGKTIVLEADIIASTYYLISRYEEMVRRDDRDQHGRFPGKHSLPYRAGFIHRPIVDEYSRALRELLVEAGLLCPATDHIPLFGKVNLTHDIDSPYQYRGIRSLFRAVIHDGLSPWEGLKRAFRNVKYDPFFTFPKFLDWNNKLKKACPEGLVDTIFFLKMPSQHPLDKPNYHPKGRYIRPVLQIAKRYDVLLGLHCSYAAGLNPDLIRIQKAQYKFGLGELPLISRHHYLALREPEDSLALYNAGIRHDYTMGYADVAGFRLGTCRPVKFINPNTRVITELIMHPLTMMEVTLSRPNYMGMQEEEAYAYAEQLIRNVAEHHGELNLLWHNDSLSMQIHPWQARLYRSILRLIEEIEQQNPKHTQVSQDSPLGEVIQRYGAKEIHL